MKMQKSMWRALGATVLFLGLILPIGAADRTAIGWYCVRNNEHKQPRLGYDLQMVEQYHGYYIDKTHGDENEEKVVYLTFDAGYENGNIEKTLNTLKEHDVKGAFFILGNLIEKNTALVRRMGDEGHLVCNHTNKHKDMTRVQTLEDFRRELADLESLYSEYTGRQMAKYYRPPEGKFSEQSMRFADELGYKTIFWSFAYADWDNNKQPDAQKAKAKILDNMHNGAVILLHPTSAVNAEILGDVIVALKKEGYRFGTLDELTAGGCA